MEREWWSAEPKHKETTVKKVKSDPYSHANTRPNSDTYGSSGTGRSSTKITLAHQYKNSPARASDGRAWTLENDGATIWSPFSDTNSGSVPPYLRTVTTGHSWQPTRFVGAGVTLVKYCLNFAKNSDFFLGSGLTPFAAALALLLLVDPVDLTLLPLGDFFSPLMMATTLRIPVQTRPECLCD